MCNISEDSVINYEHNHNESVCMCDSANSAAILKNKFFNYLISYNLFIRKSW